MEAENRSQRREVYYQGVVQGVGFRYTARRLASRYPVTGYVRNEPDGRVLVVVEGTSDAITQLLAAIEDQFRHYIHGTQVTSGEPTGQFQTFDIRF